MIKVASLQLAHKDNETKEERITRAEKLIQENGDADLVLLPEVWNIGWTSWDVYPENAETLEGETISRIAAKARQVNSYVLAGTIIEKGENALYNTAVLLDPKGKTIAVYRKMHLSGWMKAREPEVLKRGEEIVTVKTELGVMGLSICYDIRFPELFRKMSVLHGVEIFLHTSAWPNVRLDNWREMCHVRAAENLCFLVSCNACGTNHGVQYAGHSAVIDPWGIPRTSAGLWETVVRGTIDLNELNWARKYGRALEDRFLPV